MPLRGAHSNIVRLVVGERGTVPMHLELVLRFGYGAIVPWVTRLEDGALRAIAGPDMAILHTPVNLKGRDMTTVADFTVSAGETVPFVLTYSPSHLDPPSLLDAQWALHATETFWRDWAGKCRGCGPWSQAVRRSLITLKALTYAPTGGIVAAPTTSLPEAIGGVRNWDYRFCWVRDATLTLFAFMSAGYFEEAQAWREWLVRAVAGSPEQIQIMYGLSGERRLTEWEVPWLPGYEESAPVRVGNDAYRQLQLDVFGEVMSTFHHSRRGGLATTESGWALQVALLDHLSRLWVEPDEGIWEVRGGRRHFTFSKVMAWIAFDRAIKSAETYGLEAPLEDWRRLCGEIHDQVCQRAYDPELGSFVQSYGSKELDASLLLMAKVGFLPIDDPRMSGTVAAIERGLVVDGFVLRYRSETTPDGLPAGEGVFLACSFWLADVYMLQGRMEEAKRLLDRLIGLCNDVGLLSEEYDPERKRLVGNFPQAFSHVALVNSAYNFLLAGTDQPEARHEEVAFE